MSGLRNFLPIALASLAWAPSATAAQREFASGRTTFAVQVGDETLEYATMAVSCLPGDTLQFAIPLAKQDSFSILAEGPERPQRVSDTPRWTWKAPGEPGTRLITIVRDTTKEAMHVRVFILVPASRIVDGKLRGYAIGDYPDETFRGLAAYRAPGGFIEVTTQTVNLPVAPHFRLRQFLCKQAGGYPKYVLVSTRLLRALELVLEKLNAAGRPADTLFIMSGYRTPLYNASLRDTIYSRHQWGDAADVFPDRDGDGQIDDLDRDGRSDDGRKQRAHPDRACDTGSRRPPRQGHEGRQAAGVDRLRLRSAIVQEARRHVRGLRHRRRK
jgi:hypothetical protein